MSHHHHHRMRDQMQDAWPALGTWQVQLTKGNVRVGDRERDDAARALGEHFAAGRLDREEYDERMDAVLGAKTWGDLTPAFRDLPSPVATPPRAVPDTTRPRHFRLPFLPVLLILIGVSVLAGTWWVFWIGLGAFLLSRRAARRSAYSRGSWRPPRGSWS